MNHKPTEQYFLMLKGESFKFDDYLLYLQNETNKKLIKINHLPFQSHRRERLLNKLFATYGKNNILKSEFFCNFGFNIEIGNDCYVNSGVIMLDSSKITIRNRVFIAPGVILAPVDHPLIAEHRKELIVKPIVIEDDVWIGANAVILPGVTVHSRAVIGAGAVVTKDVPASTIVAGVPAKELRKLNPLL